MTQLQDLFTKYLNHQYLSPSEMERIGDWVATLEYRPEQPGRTLAELADTVDILQAQNDSLFQGMGVIQESSQISEGNAGLFVAGEFRSGNGATPGAGFTGGRYGYPGFVYGGSTYFLAGVQNDVLQVGLSLTDGKIYFGAGAGRLDSTGISMYSGTVLRASFQADGDLFIGSNLSAAGTTTLSVFTNAQTYNGESMGAGDLLIGDNSTGQANVFWDYSAGRLNFRSGVTAQVYMDTDGTIKAAGGEVKIDTNGILIIGDGTNRIIWKGSGGSLTIGDIYGVSVTGTSGVALQGYGVNTRDGYSALIAYESNTTTYYNSLSVNTGSGVTIDLTGSSVKTVNSRAVNIKNEISTSALSNLLYLDAYKNSAPSAGLGSAIAFRSENSTPALTDLGYIGMRFNTVTAGAEDTEMVIAIKAAGASKELMTWNQQGMNVLNNANLRGAAFTLATDAATSFTPMRVAGEIIIGTSGGGNGGLIYYHTGTPACAIMVAGANIAVTTGALTGTTGTAGKITVSAHAADGKVYLENRSGATKTLWINLL